jgi:hypothetical protein
MVPKALEDPVYEEFRSAAHNTLQAELPRECPVGYVAFDASWTPQPPTEKLIPPAASSACARAKVLELMKGSELTMRSSPKFHPRWFVWPVLTLWTLIELFLLRDWYLGLAFWGLALVVGAFAFALDMHVNDPHEQNRTSLTIFGALSIICLSLVLARAAA